jgi:peptidoglycan L-alanyl-D-glutamate endopeptidase CwlK
MIQYKTLHPDLQKVCDESIKYYDFVISEGFRGKDAQNAAYNKGASQKQWPNGEHNHMPSTAMDCYPWPVDWSDAEKNTQRTVLMAGIMLGVAHMLGIKLRWGGDWNQDGDTRDEHFRDYGHLELAK